MYVACQKFTQRIQNRLTAFSPAQRVRDAVVRLRRSSDVIVGRFIGPFQTCNTIILFLFIKLRHPTYIYDKHDKMALNICKQTCNSTATTTIGEIT